MQSEFQQVALDRIRYSLVWESSHTLYQALQIEATDRLLVICSAGCNVLNTLLKAPREVVAIDLNPVQLRLLQLKKLLIMQHDYSVFRGLMGFDGASKVAEAWQVVAAALNPADRGYWASFFADHPTGIMQAGKLERYLNGFLPHLPLQQQQALHELLRFEEVKAQQAFFLRELHSSGFRRLFEEYFDEQHLSKGRDPKLFRYATESGGAAFYQRLLAQIGTVPVKDNFFFRFFFFGPVCMPEHILPPCYQQKNYAVLRAQLPKLRLVEGEAVDYLLSEEGRSLNKASLSNIFEYTSPEEFQKVCRALFADPGRKLRAVYWNLLQDQGAGCLQRGWQLQELSEKLSQQEECFYFRNVRVLETVPAAVAV